VGTVFAEDAAATFAVSSRGLVDAELRTLVVPFAREVAAAVLVRNDSEVWSYDSTSSQLVWANVSDLLAGHTLGVRVAAADDIKTYTFDKLIADPARPRLYGLDVKRSVLVSIDRQTGQALSAAVVEGRANDVVIDQAGQYLYVGHSGLAIEQIDAASLALVKYIFGPRYSYDLAMLSGNRLATIDDDQWTELTIIDPTSEKVVTSVYGSHEAALSVTADGNTIFVGDSRLEWAVLLRFDVSSAKLATAASSDEYTNPPRGVVATPDGRRVFYAGYCLDGAEPKARLYAQADPVLSITPDGALAISSSQIYRVADGSTVTALPVPCPVQALSPDGSTLYCSGGAGVRDVGLAGLR
jgi:DNA-binding beta-propeller fold protein YncE